MPEVKIKRMNINVEFELHKAFKVATADQGVNMTDVLLDFIRDYVAKHGMKPAKKGRRQ